MTQDGGVSIADYLDHSLEQLAAFYSAMEAAAGAVDYDESRKYGPFRHPVKTEALACFLKGIKSISTLRACVVLLRAGYAQEVGALCRMADDFCNEIFFLLMPDGEDGRYSDHQIRFVNDFFKEEFDDPAHPLESTQKRSNVPVAKIHSMFGRMAAHEMNPSDAKETLRTVHQAFSGYVHGAYPHIMEMYAGEPPHFYTAGMSGTRLVAVWEAQLVGYVYRLIMATVFIGRKLGVTHLDAALLAMRDDYEQKTGSKSARSAGEILADYKRKGAF